VGAVPLNGKTLFNLAVLALLGWALVWLFVSDRFYVQRVAASGNSYLPPDLLERASGLQGYSVFWINPRQVEDRIKEDLPPVESVRVRHGFIEKGRLGAWTRLEVQERDDEIVWEVAGQSYWVAEDGRLCKVPSSIAESRASTGAGPAGPRLVIHDTRPNPPAAGDLVAIASARELIRLLPEIRVLEYAPVTGLHYKHPEGWWVYLGTGGDMMERVGALRTAEAKFARENEDEPDLVDLRFPHAPYYR
jgi:hypothetical protein